MGWCPPQHRRSAARAVAAGAVTAAVVLSLASCSTGQDSRSGGPSGPAAVTPAAGTPPAGVTAVINQLRDNYSEQVIAVQLTNTTPRPLTVLGAGVASPLYSGTAEWQPGAGGTELPPGQTKILLARLPAPVCASRPAAEVQGAQVQLRLAGSAGTGQDTAVPAADPFAVLERNNQEMCLAQAVAAVAGLRLEPDLAVTPDGQSAVLTLAVTPRETPGAADPAEAGTLTIHEIYGTTLLEEDSVAAWPRGSQVQAGGPGQVFRLGIRPARCDPHAVADDKVGTLLPLKVSAGGREGILKIAAGAPLRGLIYDFMTAACGRQ